MKRQGFLLVFLLLVMLLPMGALAGPELVQRFTDEQLVNILKADGYYAVSILDPGELLIKIDGHPHLLYVEDDGDLRAYYGISGVKVSYQDINTWNRTKRLSRAFLDEENDPVLESDLLANGGLTPKHVTEFLRVFVDSANAFHDFVLKHEES